MQVEELQQQLLSQAREVEAARLGREEAVLDIRRQREAQLQLAQAQEEHVKQLQGQVCGWKSLHMAVCHMQALDDSYDDLHCLRCFNVLCSLWVKDEGNSWFSCASMCRFCCCRRARR